MAKSKLPPRTLVFSLVKARGGRSHYWTTHFEGALRQHSRLSVAAADLNKVLMAIRDGEFEVRTPDLEGNLEQSNILERGWLAIPALTQLAKGKRVKRKSNEVPKTEKESTQ